MKKILLIDDDRDILDIVAFALADNYQILTKSNGSGLLAVLDEFTPDLMLVDNYVGQMQACEIARQLRASENHCKLPFILFSGHHKVKDIAREIGAIAWLAKPFDLDQLYRCVEEALCNTVSIAATH